MSFYLQSKYTKLISVMIDIKEIDEIYYSR